MSSLGAGTVVEVVGGTVVLPPGGGGSEGVGAALRAECPAGDVATEATPAPVARTRRVTTTIHELALPGLRIPPLANPSHPYSRPEGEGGWHDSVIPKRF